MVSWVLDTSVVAKWFLQEEGSDRAEPYLTALDSATARVFVPSSLFFELANVFWVRRRDGLTAVQARQIWEELAMLPLNVIDWKELFPQSLTFAFNHGISPYDAVFVTLARETACDLITADRPLLERLHKDCPWVRAL